MTRTIIDKDDRSGYVAIEYDGRTDMKKITDLEWIVKKKESNKSEENNRSGVDRQGKGIEQI